MKTINLHYLYIFKTLRMTALIGAFLAFFPLLSHADTSKASGAADDFTLKSSTGENLKLSEQRGSVVMVNFWASWCGPCRKEMPIIDALYKKYSKYGFTVFGVNVDDKEKNAIRTLKKIPVDFPILFNPENSIAELYGVSAMPTTIFIDRNGNKRYIHAGYKEGEEVIYEKIIKKLIRE